MRTTTRPSPSTNFAGPDTFTYTVTDSEGDPGTATVHLNVGAPLHFMSITAQTNGAMLMRICGEHGSNYQMQATSDFISWTNLGSLFEGSRGGLEFLDVSNGPVEIRFYRVASP